ncbi:MAG: RloB family protein [Bacteroidales bacterium]
MNEKDVYVISIAGEGKTEEHYFDGLSDYLKGKVILIDRLEKDDEEDTKSHPNHVFNLLEERRDYWREYGAESDELWMVVDRDRQNVSEKQLENIINKCNESSFNLALSNPTFELWLLLHVSAIDKFDAKKLLENPKKSSNSKKRFLEILLSEISDGYNKSRLDFEKFKPGLEDAIVRAKKLPVSNSELINSLGTSVCLLVEQILSDRK